MGLVSKNNGDPITANAYNDFMNLLTGVMQDQLVKLVALLTVKSRGAAPAAPTAAVAAGGSVDAGAHTYAVTFVDSAGGETVAGSTVVATTAGGNLTVNLTAIPTGPTGTTSRKIYRSKAGTTTPLFLVTTLANNTATTYSDTAADASLPATNPPTHPSFGGSTQWQDNTGAVRAQVFSDGSFVATGVSNTQNMVDGILPSVPASNVGVMRVFVTGDTIARASLQIRGDGFGQLALQDGANPGNNAFLYGSTGGVINTSGNLGITGNGIATSGFQWGAGTSGSLSKISYDGTNHATDYWTPQAGASAQGHQFVTWDGASSKIPFSIGIQVFALSYVDNAGHFYDNGKNIPLIQPNGTTAGRQIFLGTATPTGANEGDIWIKA